jgi:hypothetical protein
MSRVEVWKPIPSCPGWTASSYGRLAKDSFYPMPNGGVKHSIVHPTFGHKDQKKLRFKLMVNNKTRWVAPLVCEAFHGSRPHPDWECMHLDEDCTNNCEDNLAWGTASENQRAEKLSIARRERLRARHVRRLVPDDDLPNIRAMDGQISPAELAAVYGVTPVHMSRLMRGIYRGGERG